jgi:hypothetical protein
MKSIKNSKDIIGNWKENICYSSRYELIFDSNYEDSISLASPESFKDPITSKSRYKDDYNEKFTDIRPLTIRLHSFQIRV